MTGRKCRLPPVLVRRCLLYTSASKFIAAAAATTWNKLSILIHLDARGKTGRRPGNGGVGDRGERSFGGSGRRRPRPSRRCPVPSLSHGESTATDRSIRGRFRSISAELGEETVGHHPSTKRTAYRCHDEGQYDQR